MYFSTLIVKLPSGSLGWQKKGLLIINLHYVMKTACGLFKHNCIEYWISDLKGVIHFKVFPTKKLKKYLCLLWVRKCVSFRLLVFLSAWPAPLLHSWPGWWLHAFWSAQERQHYCFVLIFFSERVTSQLSWIWSNSSASLRLLLTVPLSQVCPSFDLCLLILNIPPTWEARSPNAGYVRLWKQKYGDSNPDS